MNCCDLIPIHSGMVMPCMSQSWNQAITKSIDVSDSHLQVSEGTGIEQDVPFSLFAQELDHTKFVSFAAFYVDFIAYHESEFELEYFGIFSVLSIHLML